MEIQQHTIGFSLGGPFHLQYHRVSNIQARWTDWNCLAEVDHSNVSIYDLERHRHFAVCQHLSMYRTFGTEMIWVLWLTKVTSVNESIQRWYTNDACHSLDGKTVWDPTVSEMLAVPAKCWCFGRIPVKNKCKSVTTVDCTRFMHVSWEGSIYVICTFNRMISDFPAECCLKACQYRHSRLVPDGSSFGWMWRS